MMMIRSTRVHGVRFVRFLQWEGWIPTTFPPGHTFHSQNFLSFFSLIRFLHAASPKMIYALTNNHTFSFPKFLFRSYSEQLCTILSQKNKQLTLIFLFIHRQDLNPPLCPVPSSLSLCHADHQNPLSYFKKNLILIIPFPFPKMSPSNHSATRTPLQ